jgi:hypothetical protein
LAIPRPLRIAAVAAVGLVLLVIVIRPLMRLVLPGVLPVSVLLPAEPYALDDPAARSRVADGWSTATFPAAIDFTPHGPGVFSAEVKLNVPADRPGQKSQLRIYQPAASAAPASLGCILGSRSGGAFLTAADQPAVVDEDEWLPYVQRAGIRAGPNATGRSQSRVRRRSQFRRDVGAAAGRAREPHSSVHCLRGRDGRGRALRTRDAGQRVEPDADRAQGVAIDLALQPCRQVHVPGDAIPQRG